MMTYTTGLWLWRWEARWADRADDQDWPLGWRQRGRRAWGQPPDPYDSLMGPPRPNYCGTCEKALVESEWQPTELRLIIQGIFRPSVEKERLQGMAGGTGQPQIVLRRRICLRKREPSIWENKANIGLGCPTQRHMFVLQNWHKLEPWSVMIFANSGIHSVLTIANLFCQ